MFSGLFHDVLRMFSGCSDGSCGPGGSRGSLGSSASCLSCESSGFGGSIWLGGSEGPSGSCESGWRVGLMGVVELVGLVGIAYMQKTCDVTEKAILAKKNCGKSA